MIRHCLMALCSIFVATQGVSTPQHGRSSADTLTLSPTMLATSFIQPQRTVYKAYVLPCANDPRGEPRYFGVFIERTQLVKRGDSTFIRQITRSPLLSGGYAFDTAMFVQHSLIPVLLRGHAGSLSIAMNFWNDSVTWEAKQGNVVEDVGRAPMPRGAMAVVGDRLLVRSLKDLGKLTGKVVRVNFIDMPGMGTGAIFEGYLAVSSTDSVPLPHEGIRSGWAVAVGSGSDKVYFLDPHTRQILGWERAENEGICPLRYLELGIDR